MLGGWWEEVVADVMFKHIHSVIVVVVCLFGDKIGEDYLGLSDIVLDISDLCRNIVFIAEKNVLIKTVR